MIKKLIALLFFISISAFAYPTKTLITEPNDGQEPLIQSIAHAQHEVDIVMYNFTSRSFMHALTRDVNRGIKVKVLLEFSPYKTQDINKRAISYLKSRGVSVKSANPKFSLTHEKAIMIDNKIAWIMTMNFTYSGFHRQRNFAVEVTQPKLVKDIVNVFNADWNRTEADTDTPPLLWSPTTMRSGLRDLIASAHKSIKVYAASMSDYKLIGEFARKARSLPVEILTSPGRIKQGKKNYLKRHGAKVEVINDVHAKMILVDDKQAYLGSANFTQPSLDKNRELGIIISNPKIISQLNSQFDKDFD